ncbi:acyltransferase-like protein [Coniochaeta sp. 2T2.1]|nr:acyltransferase-like protein [Coniochaeta sp. 2T2.1]
MILVPTGGQHGGAAAGPSLPWRMASSLVLGVSSCISKTFLFGLNKTEVYGLQRFLEMVDDREDPAKRTKGLITVSNHISVLDDPVMWSVLPLKYTFRPYNARWGLGAHDICFTNRMFASFFTYGQVLPTHRLKHSTNGGLFQPTWAEAIRLLSSPSSSTTIPYPKTFSTTGTDVVPSPSVHPTNRHAWVHVFPEGAVHQHPDLETRYFRWGVSRLILESEPLPDVVPMFIDGFQKVMPEDRGFPRFLPRIGKHIRVVFGEKVDGEAVFGDLRRRWRELVAARTRDRLGRVVEEGGPKEEESVVVGELRDEELREGREAREIRIEVARRVRDEVMKLRRRMGYPEENPRLGNAETWAEEKEGKRYKSAVDGSFINQD